MNCVKKTSENSEVFSLVYEPSKSGLLCLPQTEPLHIKQSPHSKIRQDFLIIHYI